VLFSPVAGCSNAQHDITILPEALNYMFRHFVSKMPSTRTSHTTSRYFPLGSNGSSSATPRQRRVTRSSSTAQFKQSSPAAAKADAASQHEGSDAETGNLSFGSDIEDAIARTRKRRKITTTSVGIKTEAQRSTTTTTTGGSTKPATPRRARKPARKKTDPATGNVDVSPPSDWREMYDAVLAMRREGGVAAHAAVDTMGCERLADETASPRDQRFHTLVALMLSSQTKDTVNAVVMQRLKTELPAYKEGAPVGLNLENMLAVDAERLNEMIWAVGFHNNKTKYGPLFFVLSVLWNSKVLVLDFRSWTGRGLVFLTNMLNHCKKKDI